MVEKIDKQFIIDTAGQYTANELSDKFCVNKSSIYNIARRLNIKIKLTKTKKVFTEDDFLNSIKSSYSHREAAIKLGYSSLSCLQVNNILGAGTYGIYFRKLKPDISHFSFKSRSQINKGKYNRKLLIENCYNILISESKRRNIEVEINIDNFEKLITKSCYYCGALPSYRRYNRSYGKSKNVNKLRRNGIDRIDSIKGYTLENCRTCCEQCNHAKLDYTEQEHFQMCKNTYEKHHLENWQPSTLTAAEPPAIMEAVSEEPANAA